MPPKNYNQWPMTKRAGRACLSCRARKVKCDVEEHGQPCSNCLTDEAICQVQKSKRGRKPAHDTTKRPTVGERTAAPRRGQSDSAEVDLRRFPAKHTAGWLTDYPHGHADMQSGIVNLDPARDEDLKRHIITTVEFDDRFLHQELTYVSLIDQKSVSYFQKSDSSISDITSTDQTSPSAESIETNPGSLPEFIKPLPSTLSTDDLHYLRLKGALDIPSDVFRQALVRSYIRYVHPFMSLVDTSSFFGYDHPQRPKIGILFFQAAMFAAVTFVDVKEIKKAGFASRRVARKIFYQRTKLLYDLDAETDRLATIQAALLMSYWNETPGDRKGGWHWMGIAVSLSQTLGLNRKAEYAVSSPRSRLFKRIWWSCYIRDRMLGLGMCRPFRVKDSEFDTPALTLDDFDIKDYSKDATLYDLPSVECQTALAQLCINMTELCRLLTNVLDLHYTLLPNDTSTSPMDKSPETSTLLFLRTGRRSPMAVRALDHQLEEWRNSLPPSSVYNSQKFENHDPIVVVHQAFLQITYWSVISALHRPQIQHQYGNLEAPGVDTALERSTARIEEARLAVSTINHSLHQLHLDHYLPPTTVTMQIPAIIAHVQRLQMDNHRNGEKALHSLYDCFKMVETLQDLYVGADLVMGLVLDLLKKMDIVPLISDNLKSNGLVYRRLRNRPTGFPQQQRQLQLQPQPQKLLHNAVQTPPQTMTPSTNASQGEEDGGVGFSRPDPAPGAAGASASAGADLTDPNFDFAPLDPMDFVNWEPPSTPFDAMDFEETFGMLVDCDSLQFMETTLSP